MQPQLSPPISLSSPRHPPPPLQIFHTMCTFINFEQISSLHSVSREIKNAKNVFYRACQMLHIAAIKSWRKVEVNQRNPCNKIFGLILTRSFLIQDQIVYEKQLRKQKAWFLIWLVNLVSSSSWRGLIFFLSLHVCMYFTYVWMGKQLQRQENIDKTFLTCL